MDDLVSRIISESRAQEQLFRDSVADFMRLLAERCEILHDMERYRLKADRRLSAAPGSQQAGEAQGWRAAP